ncbi:uncharacterized protein I206_104867 [Kwoniella pini CBS 10737]|uniref:Mutanase n=1 Tax=Kwoniella pini CBS 10737 TaxID=1296096 RepID=A0A1B9I7Y3_9TREE|nr:uncharacterized protein I206_02407 [Kwoniella pini CBS 10737]OCF51692.1 hypothetical protein I206_02407 [Kwoniella pini CBS 10737]
MKLVAALSLLQVLPAVLANRHGNSYERRSRAVRHEDLAERQVIETTFETETIWVDALPTDTSSTDAPATTQVQIAALAASDEDSTVTTTSSATATVQTDSSIYGLSQSNSQSSGSIGSFVSSSESLTSTNTASSVSATGNASSTISSQGLNISTDLNVTVSSQHWGFGHGSGSKNSDKKVFAHFMIGIVYGYTLDSWLEDIALAKSKGIDGFALNIGLDFYTQPQLDLAYKAAEISGDFVCFISFDFNWYTVDNTTGVTEMMRRYNNLPSQFKVDNKPFVSSFIGDGFDWEAVGKSLNQDIYAVPFWQPTQENANNKGLSGLFSWTAWASKDNGPIDQPLTTVQDKAYIDVVSKVNKVYMAPVSSWFFTHFGKEVPWSKNWLFKSENLWKYRWDQILELSENLNYVEIVTWNDYGESHNIRNWGGLHSDDGSSKWSDGLEHFSMLDLSLPYIKAFKQGKKKPIIEKDQIIYWYRPHLKSAECDETDNFGSKPTGWDIVSDTVFVTTFTKLGGVIKVTSGKNKPVLKTVKPGVQSIEIPMGVGKQVFEFFTLTGGYKKGESKLDISDKCWTGIYNYNYHAGVLDC